MEPGRSIVADAGMTVYTVCSVKHIPNCKNYVIVDGGMTDNPRYCLYGAKYTVLHADREAEQKVLFDLAGRCKILRETSCISVKGKIPGEETDMREKILCLLMILVLAAAAGCGRVTPEKDGSSMAGTKAAPTGTDQSHPEETQPLPEKLAEIRDGEGKRLGEIDAVSACSAACGGIFYSVIWQKEYASAGTAYYRFFRAETGEDILLGMLEDQSYETAYARCELDGTVYTLAVCGNVLDEEPDVLWLLAFDPAAGTMTKYEVTKYGFPYAAMAAADGRLLIMNHEMSSPKCDKVYEFDPASGTVRELLSFPDDGKASLRSIAAAEDGFYLLRLGLAGQLPEKLYLDRYDGGGKLKASQSLDELIVPVAKDLPGFEGEDDVMIEFGMPVSGFAVQEGRCLFYENFGRVRVTADLEKNEVLFAGDDLWSMAHGGAPAFYELAFEPYEAGKGPEIVCVREGTLQPLPLGPADDRFFLQAASCAADGTWLLRMADSAGEEIIYLQKEP